MSHGFTMPSQILGSTTFNPFYNEEVAKKLWSKPNPLYNKNYMSGKATKGGLVARPNLLFRPRL